MLYWVYHVWPLPSTTLQLPKVFSKSLHSFLVTTTLETLSCHRFEMEIEAIEKEEKEARDKGEIVEEEDTDVRAGSYLEVFPHLGVPFLLLQDTKTDTSVDSKDTKADDASTKAESETAEDPDDHE